MNRHPRKKAILDKLIEITGKLGDEFDRHIDPTEGYVLGNSLRDLQSQVKRIQDEEEKRGKRGFLKLV
jgi:hypothetical protein